MIDKIIKFSVYNPKEIFFIILILLGLGFYSFRSLPIDAVPDITNVQVQVNTRVPALTPETTETIITYPIEIAMNSIPNVDSIRSITRFGLSQVTIIFEDGTDIYFARQLVNEKLQTVELPGDVQPELGPVSTGLGEIVHYTLKAKEPEKNTEKRNIQLMKLRTVQEWDIIPRILNVKGVAEVNSIGGYEERYYVKPNLKKLAYYGIHLDELSDALEQNYNSGGGFLEQTANQLIIQGTGIFKTLSEVEDVVVRQLENLQTIRIKDIAEISYDKELRTGAAVCGAKECVLGSVFMLMGENSRQVAFDAVNKLNEIKKDLPEWVDLEILYNRSELVDGTIQTVTHNLVYGALLVIIILFALVGNFRVALITAFTIPLAMLSMIFLMRLSGTSGNLMSLGALDFGVIIDGAVIVMDSIARTLQQKKSEHKQTLTRTEIKEIVVSATLSIRQAAGYGQLIIVIVFIPMFGLTGVEGKMFTPMAIAFCFALVSAFVFSFTIIPSLAAQFLSGDMNEKEPWLSRTLKTGYLPLLKLVMKVKFAFVFIAASALLGGFLVFKSLGGIFMPELYEGAIAVQLIRPMDINLTQSVKLEQITEEVILEFEEVSNVFSRIGTAEISTDPMGVNLSDTFVMLKPRNQWPEVEGNVRTPKELGLAIKKKIQKEVPGQRVLLTQPIRMRFNELLEGIRADLSLKIFGKNLETLDALSQKAVSLIKRMPNSGDVEAESQGKSPILDIVPRTKVLTGLGIGKKQILDAIEIALAGKKVNYIYQDSIRVPVYIRLDSEIRNNMTNIKNLPIPISFNYTLPLHEVAEIKIAEQYTTIKRENSKRRSAIMLNPSGSDTEGFVKSANEKLQKELSLPPGYYLEWGGKFKNMQQARTRLFILAPLALCLVFFIIFTAFKKIIPTLLIFISVPFALVGGALNLFIMGLPFSISAGVGFIALMGIAVLNSLVLVSYLNKLKFEGKSGEELILTGATLRLRAILMTATAAALGFLPMMLATGLGAEVQRPLATVVVGGIITSTLMSLFLLPVLYSLFEKYIEVSDDSIQH